MKFPEVPAASLPPELASLLSKYGGNKKLIQEFDETAWLKLLDLSHRFGLLFQLFLGLCHQISQWT